MIRSYLLAFLALSLCSASFGADKVVVSRPDSKIVAAISLRNTSPTAVMWGLKLFSLDDLEAGTTELWSASSQKSASKPSAMAVAEMPGMDMIVPCDSDQVLIAYGTREAISKLRESVAALDVARKQVQVKAQFVTVTSAEAKNNGLGDQPGEPLANQLTQMLTDGTALIVNSPVVSTPTGVPCTVSLDADQCKTHLSALPKINGDGTVSLTVKMSLNAASAGCKQSLFTQFRTAPGHPIAVGGFSFDDGGAKEMFMLLTPTVVD